MVVRQNILTAAKQNKLKKVRQNKLIGGFCRRVCEVCWEGDGIVRFVIGKKVCICQKY